MSSHHTTRRPQRHAWAAMSPLHYLRAALLACRLRSRGLAVAWEPPPTSEPQGCADLLVTAPSGASVVAYVPEPGASLTAFVLPPVGPGLCFADSPADLAALVAAELLPSPTAQPSPPRHRAHQRECPCTPFPR